MIIYELSINLYFSEIFLYIYKLWLCITQILWLIVNYCLPNDAFSSTYISMRPYINCCLFCFGVMAVVKVGHQNSLRG